MPKPEPQVLNPGARFPKMDWRIVLVRPRNPLNIGAAARAMANFGLNDLVVVEPYGPAWQETRSAIGAEHLIRSARATRSLIEALDGITLIVGTTSGQRRKLNRDLVSLEDLFQWMQDRGRHEHSALLFGSEKTGLSNEHLSYCHVLLRIPTSARCPSMNLGQAVAVCCFELSRAVKNQNAELRTQKPAFSRPLIAKPQPVASQPASIQCIDHVFERAVSVLDDVGYLKPKSRQATIIKLRRMLVARGLSSHDARILGGILAQIDWKLEKDRG